MELYDEQTKEKLLVLSTLWTTFAGAFLLVVTATF